MPSYLTATLGYSLVGAVSWKDGTQVWWSLYGHRGFAEATCGS